MAENSGRNSACCASPVAPLEPLFPLPACARRPWRGRLASALTLTLTPESCEAGNQVLVHPRPPGAQIWAQPGCTLHASLLREIWDQGLPRRQLGREGCREDDLPVLFLE